jgi:hypothetical protein
VPCETSFLPGSPSASFFWFAEHSVHYSKGILARWAPVYVVGTQGGFDRTTELHWLDAGDQPVVETQLSDKPMPELSF